MRAVRLLAAPLSGVSGAARGALRLSLARVPTRLAVLAPVPAVQRFSFSSSASPIKLSTHKGASSAPAPAPAAESLDLDADEGPEPIDRADVGPDFFTLTPAAISRLKALQKTHGPTHALRVFVDTGGCSGFQYKFTPEDLPSPPQAGPGAPARVDLEGEDDVVFSCDGAATIVDDVSLPFLKGARLDFKSELIRSGFAVVDNPNVDLACGCGTSFARKG